MIGNTLLWLDAKRASYTASILRLSTAQENGKQR
jgi:hypothetical protein